MKLLLRLLGGLAALVLLLVLIAFVLPRHFHIERAAVIQAAPDTVYSHVGDLRQWQKWTAWHERDPQMKLSFSENTAGVGAWSAWESETEGNGKMTITANEPPHHVRYTLEFPDFGMVSTGSVSVEPATGGVRVVWISEGDLGLNPMNRWFGLWMDGMVGGDFEHGLAKLKRITEAAPKPPGAGT